MYATVKRKDMKHPHAKFLYLYQAEFFAKSLSLSTIYGEKEVQVYYNNVLTSVWVEGECFDAYGRPISNKIVNGEL